MAKHRITQTPHDSPGTLLFSRQLFFEIRTGSPPKAAPNVGGVGRSREFLQITRRISKTVQDKRIISIKDE